MVNEGPFGITTDVVVDWDCPAHKDPWSQHAGINSTLNKVKCQNLKLGCFRG